MRDAFIRGLTTFGTSFPLVLNIKVKFCNEREYIDGTGCAHAVANAAHQKLQMAVLRPFMQGRPILICQYNKSALTISPSSAVLNSQSIPHSSSMQAVKQAVSQRAAQQV